MASEGGFAKIRKGLRDHLGEGKLSPGDIGVYLYLHLNCDYMTGTYTGTAMGVAYGYGDVTLTKQVQRSFSKLKREKFINYRKGDGRKHAYIILIDKYEVQAGEHLAKRLNAWFHGDKVIPAYFTCGGERDRDAIELRQNCSGGAAEEGQRRGRDAAVSGIDLRPIKEERNKEKKSEEQSSKQATSQPVCLLAQTNSVSSDSTEKDPSPSQSISDIRLWNEDKHGIPAHLIRNAVIYNLDFNPKRHLADYYFASRGGITLSKVRDNSKFVAAMVDEVPPGWTPDNSSEVTSAISSAKPRDPEYAARMARYERPLEPGEPDLE